MVSLNTRFPQHYVQKQHCSGSHTGLESFACPTRPDGQMSTWATVASTGAGVKQVSSSASTREEDKLYSGMGQWRSWIQNFPGQKTDQTAFGLWPSGQFVSSAYKNHLLAIAFSIMYCIGHMLCWLFVKRPKGPEFNGNRQVVTERKSITLFQCL